jgi:hypothetical protein
MTEQEAVLVKPNAPEQLTDDMVYAVEFAFNGKLQYDRPIAKVKASDRCTLTINWVPDFCEFDSKCFIIYKIHLT